MSNSFYNDFFINSVEKIKNEGRYRNFVNIVRSPMNFPKAYFVDHKKEVVVWCSNDYLGMGQSQHAINAMIETAKNMGTGSGGTRNIAGTHCKIIELETEMAQIHQKEAALLFTSGYVANQGAISTIPKIIADIVVISDAENHASIIDGISHSRAQKHVFRHNDVHHLTEILERIDINQPKIIIFESVYSMSGTIAPIREICAIAQRFNAMTYIDEVHAVGIYGKHGGGISERENVSHMIDIIQGNFGKSYGTMGGYITANSHIIDAIRLNAPGFIFTTSIPPALAAATLSNVQYLRYSNSDRFAHQEAVLKTKRALRDNGIEFLDSKSHIIPIVIGDAMLCRKISEELLEKHEIYVQYINYPTVPMGGERLRITPTPYHNDEMISALIHSLKCVFAKYKLGCIAA